MKIANKALHVLELLVKEFPKLISDDCYEINGPDFLDYAIDLTYSDKELLAHLKTMVGERQNGYGHYFAFIDLGRKGWSANKLERQYQLAIMDCQRITRRFYKEYGGISGYTAHCSIGQYDGLHLNGKKPNNGDDLSLRAHFNQNGMETKYCGTSKLPYDTLVVACLTVLKHRLGNHFKVDSCGTALTWERGVRYARKVTGLKLKNPFVK